MTIVEALKEVLKDSGGLTHKEAYDRIVARDLYHFRAKNRIVLLTMKYAVIAKI
jgi:hypothetical protein